MTDRRFFGSTVLVRIEVVTVHELDYDEPPTFRLCEQDGAIADCWLPGVELPDSEGPLDRGGFERQSDALAFKLGIDRERALFGLLRGVTVEEIDAERAQLDDVRAINGANRRKTLDDVAAAAVERMNDASQIGLNGLSDAVSKPAAPVVTHRRRRPAA